MALTPRRATYQRLAVVLAGALMAPTLAIGIFAASTPLAAADTPGAVTPPNETAYIYNTFVQEPQYKQPVKKIQKILEHEGYSFDELNNTPTGPGAARISALAGLNAGILIIAAHADAQQGLYLETYGTCAYLECTPYGPGGVEDPQYALAFAASQAYGATYGKNSTTVTGQYYYDRHTRGSVKRWTVSLDPSGLAQLFSNDKIGIVDVDGCGSQALAGDFDAGSFFGYSQSVCSPTDGQDLSALFNDLAGNNGFSLRTTTGADAAKGMNGFSPIFGLVPSASATQSVSLSPAVDESMTTPLPNGTASDGGSYQVVFDTQMNQANADQVLSIKGCGASISDAQWVSPTDLSYTMNVPESGSGKRATITVKSSEAEAGEPGFPNDLDGNKTGTNGLEPNKNNDYKWTVVCSHPGTQSGTVTATYSGTLSEVSDCSGALAAGVVAICFWDADPTWNWTEQETSSFGGSNATGSLTVTATNTFHAVIGCEPATSAPCNCTANFTETIGSPGNPPPQMIAWQSSTTFVVNYVPPIANVTIDPSTLCQIGTDLGPGGPGGNLMAWVPTTQTGLLSIDSGSVSETNGPDPSLSDPPYFPRTGNGTLTVTVTPTNGPNQTASSQVSAQGSGGHHRMHQHSIRTSRTRL
jgi:hypothetical protein